MMDLSGLEIVEVIMIRDQNGTYRLWVNGPEACLLRIYNVKELVLNDNRTGEDDGVVPLRGGRDSDNGDHSR